MVTYKLLSLDESGKASYSHPSDLFVLSGTIILRNLNPAWMPNEKNKKENFSERILVP